MTYNECPKSKRPKTVHCRRSWELSTWFMKLIPLLLMVFTPSLYAQSAFVRLNQVGYVSTASKRAYLMTATTETGATFSVINSGGSSVYSAPIGARQGAWGTFSNVYALDFDSVSTPDTYTISVVGPAAATSVSFRIDSGTSLYSGALADSLSFYQTERDGANFLPNALRSAAGHLNDQSATVYFTPTFDNNQNSGPLTPTGGTIDASGGWWDAGDYLKFVETHSYAVGMMLVGVRDFPKQMGSGSTTSNFTPEAKFGLDWLQKMWDDRSETLYYQVGVGSGGNLYLGDHDIWRLPQADDTWGGCTSQNFYICHRPVLINTAGGARAKISPNLAGRLAASFAECFQVFKVSDPAYANQCLLSAEHVFDLADTTPTGNLLTAGPFDFYGEVEWRDDLEWGATELYFALAGGGLPGGLPHTDPNFYLTAAATWANACIASSTCEAEPLNLYTVSELAHFELYRAITQAGNPSGLAVTKAALANDMNKGLQNALNVAAGDPYGFGFPWAHYDTSSFGLGLVTMANMYDNITNTTTYNAYTSRWLGNVLGANAWGISQIIGLGTTFSQCPSHQVANLAGSHNGQAPILRGAVGEGPNSFVSTGLVPGMTACTQGGFTTFNGNGAKYGDNEQSYSTNEPAIDLTAGTFLAVSWTIAGGGVVSPDFSLSATPTSQTVNAGANTTYTVTITALGGFTGSVNLSVSGLPTGATGSFNPTAVSGSGTSTLTISTSSSTPTGTSALAITGTSGSLSHSAAATLVVTSSSGGPIRFVQVNSATPSSASSVVVKYAAAQAAGDLNAVAVGWNDTTASVSSVSDTKGNVYIRAVGPTAVAGRLSQSIYYAKNIAAATAGANSVTVRFTGTAAAPDIRISEYSGLSTTNPLDVTAAATGSSINTDSGPATTTASRELLFGANMVAQTTTGPGSGYTKRIITAADGDILEDQVVAATGMYHATAPQDIAAVWIMQLVTFK